MVPLKQTTWFDGSLWVKSVLASKNVNIDMNQLEKLSQNIEL